MGVATVGGILIMDVVHLYRYEYPPGKPIYVGQGATRDSDHLAGRTSFSRRFRRDFPKVPLPAPIQWTEPAVTAQERNDLETAAIDFYHTWHREGGYNMTRPGSSDYENLGKISGRANALIMNSKMTREQRIKAGKASGPTNGKISGPLNGPINACLRWNIRRGIPCTCGKHIPFENI